MRRIAALFVAGAILGPLAAAAAHPWAGPSSLLPRAHSPALKGSQSLGGCKLLPHADALHRKVTGLDVAQDSGSIIGRIGRAHLHPDFGSNPNYGIPYAVVGKSQRDVRVHVRRGSGYPDESDRGRQPIPPNARIEGGKHSSGDRHTLVVSHRNHGRGCKLIELYRARYAGGHSHRWSADQVGVFDLGRKLPQRPRGWTSADAAGLPILPGLVRYGEVRSGRIDHAIRITFDRTRAAYRAPARHFASGSCSPKLPAMGDRLRLKRRYSLAGMSGDSKVVAQALKRYGAIVADNGSNFYISGSTDIRWKDSRLDDLKSIPGSAFQFVNTGERLVRASFC